jgi:homoserine O-acetyltransferase
VSSQPAAADGARLLRLPGPFPLESGTALPQVSVAYRTWGRLDRRHSNAVLVCHALTGSADLDSWWPDLLGPGRSLDPARDFVVCSNVLGSCYGTTGPASPRDGSQWGAEFPSVSIRDMVRLQAALLDALGVPRVRLVVGGSLGGMQALEWAVTHPDRIEAAAVIASSGRHSAWCIAWSEAQRQAIFADPRWRDGRYPASSPPEAGLAAARMMAMVSYRSRQSFEARHGRARQSPDVFAIEGYLRHQGRKLVERFDARSYVLLTRAMDGHDVARGRGAYADVLGRVRAPVLVVGIGSDVLYPLVEQEELAALLPNGELVRLESPHGHDGFLADAAALDALVRAFRARVGA